MCLCLWMQLPIGKRSGWKIGIAALGWEDACFSMLCMSPFLAQFQSMPAWQISPGVWIIFSSVWRSFVHIGPHRDPGSHLQLPYTEPIILSVPRNVLKEAIKPIWCAPQTAYFYPTSEDILFVTIFCGLSLSLFLHIYMYVIFVLLYWAVSKAHCVTNMPVCLFIFAIFWQLLQTFPCSLFTHECTWSVSS